MTVADHIYVPGGEREYFRGTNYVDSFVPDRAANVTSYCCCQDSAPCANEDPTGGCRNSHGSGAQLSARGSTSVAADDLVLVGRRLPPRESGLVYLGASQVRLPFGDGQRCVAPADSGLFRFPVRAASAGGEILEGPGVVASSPFALVPGSEWQFQLWYRDPLGPCGSGFNLSNGLAVTFVP